METGTIVEFKAGKRNTVANLEFKAFAKAFPISNMLVATVFKKTYCLCHHLPGVFKGARICKEMRRVSLTSLCWGFALQTLQCLALSCPLPSIKWLISSLQPPIQQVCVGDHQTLDDVLILCCMLLYHLGAWETCINSLNGFWALFGASSSIKNAMCLQFHFQEGFPALSLFPHHLKANHGTAVVSAMALAAAASGWPHPAPRWRPTPKTPGRAAKLLRKSVLQVYALSVLQNSLTSKYLLVYKPAYIISELLSWETKGSASLDPSHWKWHEVVPTRCRDCSTLQQIASRHLCRLYREYSHSACGTTWQMRRRFPDAVIWEPWPSIVFGQQLQCFWYTFRSLQVWLSSFDCLIVLLTLMPATASLHLCKLMEEAMI